MTLGVHFVDRLLWLIGTDVLSARGVVRQRFHSSAEQQADDSVAALLTFSSGATGSLLLAGYRSGPIWDEMQIIGERAVLRLEGQNLSVSRGEEWRSLPGEERNPMAIEWDAFASAVRDGTPPPISLDFALKVMETVFAVEESSGAGRP
jgi:predicted dehydrogenase